MCVYDCVHVHACVRSAQSTLYRVALYQPPLSLSTSTTAAGAGAGGAGDAGGVGAADHDQFPSSRPQTAFSTVTFYDVLTQRLPSVLLLSPAWQLPLSSTHQLPPTQLLPHGQGAGGRMERIGRMVDAYGEYERSSHELYKVSLAHARAHRTPGQQRQGQQQELVSEAKPSMQASGTDDESAAKQQLAETDGGGGVGDFASGSASDGGNSSSLLAHLQLSEQAFTVAVSAPPYRKSSCSSSSGSSGSASDSRASSTGGSGSSGRCDSGGRLKILVCTAQWGGRNPTQVS